MAQVVAGAASADSIINPHRCVTGDQLAKNVFVQIASEFYHETILQLAQHLRAVDMGKTQDLLRYRGCRATYGILRQVLDAGHGR